MIEDPSLAALDTRTAGHLLDGLGLAVGPSGVGLDVGSHAAVAPALVLDFGGRVVGTKATGFRSPVVSVVVMVFGGGTTMGDVSLSQMFVVC